MDLPLRSCRRGLARHLAVVSLTAISLLTTACGQPDSELQRTHTYMDSLRVYLGDLRLMDYNLKMTVPADSVSSDVIIPLIAEDLRPTVDDLRRRADGLQVTPAVAAVHALLLQYLDARLQAYDAALQGQTEGREDLFDLFAVKQIEAQEIGDDLETEAQRLRTQVPDYE